MSLKRGKNIFSNTSAKGIGYKYVMKKEEGQKCPNMCDVISEWPHFSVQGFRIEKAYHEFAT